MNGGIGSEFGRRRSRPSAHAAGEVVANNQGEARVHVKELQRGIDASRITRVPAPGKLRARMPDRQGLACDRMGQAVRRLWVSLRALLQSAGPMVVLAVALVAAAYWVLNPNPPRTMVMATGVAQGAYAEFGARYAQLLKAHGIELTLRPSQGAAENLALLRDDDAGVDLAFVQGGTGLAAATTAGSGELAPDQGLVSLGSVFYEPLWLFYREDSARRLLKAPVLSNLAQLTGWRVNAGVAGSGVPPLVAQMLAANRINSSTIEMQNQATTPAVVALLAGQIDALVLVSAPEAPMVQMLLQTPGMRLFDVVQAEAYGRRLPFLNPVVLPRGVVDLATDQPPADIHLLAPTATLVARSNLHPALVQLVVQAAQQVHGGAGWFARPGDFPRPAASDWPMSPEAERLYRKGAPWLQRYLPFWLANLGDRMWVVLLAIGALLIPLARVVPPLYEFRVRSRVFRWYAQLRSVEAAQGRRPKADLLSELDGIEARLSEQAVPLSHADELYALRSHIHLVRRRVQAG